MRNHQFRYGSRPRLATGAGAAVSLCAVAGLAACGGSSTPSSTHSPSPTPSTSVSASMAPTTGAAAVAAVKANWQEFFNPATATARRAMLLQNGQAFKGVLAAQATNPIASSAQIKVNKVTVVKPSQATVLYTVNVNGKPVLKNQTGVAVYQNGMWKVGTVSFCGLLTMENGGKTSNLPPQCKTSG
jgi:hypothetical protein